MHALQNTVVLALCTAAVSTLLGVMAAVGIFNSRHKLYKRSLMLLTNVPMMNPEIVTGISMMLLFVFAGGLVHRSNVLGFWTLLIAHVTFSLPYVILNVIPKLHQFDMNIYEAAVDLGCKPVRALRPYFGRDPQWYHYRLCNELYAVAGRFYHQLLYQRTQPSRPCPSTFFSMTKKAGEAGYVRPVISDVLDHFGFADPVQLDAGQSGEAGEGGAP